MSYKMIIFQTKSGKIFICDGYANLFQSLVQEIKKIYFTLQINFTLAKHIRVIFQYPEKYHLIDYFIVSFLVKGE